MNGRVLLLAKAPVAGLAKKRIGRFVGDDAAAELAAAALLDTIDAVETYAGSDSRMLALTGELSDAVRGSEIAHRLCSWTVVTQVGETFAARIVAAHDAAARHWGRGAATLQIGMDTPQLTAADLHALARRLDQGDCAGSASLGPAEDGGWWGLATSRAGLVEGLADVTMSTPRTGADTRRALERAGVAVTQVHTLTDMDDWATAVGLASRSPRLRFAAVVHSLGTHERGEAS